MDYQKEYKTTYRADPTNKEKEKTYAKQYRELHKDYPNEKITCIHCNATVSRNGVARHRESKKCKEQQKSKS